MSGRFYTFWALATMMTGLLASCAGERNEMDPSRVGAGRVPSVLLRIDEQAEQTVAAVIKDDWPRVYAYIQDIDDAWADYMNPTIEPERQPLMPPAATLAERVGAALGALKDAAARRDSPAAAKAANDVSAAAANLYEYYHPAIPPDLRRFEIFERRILIDLRYGAFDSASTTLSRAEEVWQRVRPTVARRAGSENVQAITDQLDLQKAALGKYDAVAVTASVETTIKLIDGIQALY